jgi:two-component system, response regulator, stage 0 sporulation protein F
MCQEPNMSRRVLSVGQCGPDHSALTRFLKGTFVVEIDTADTAAEAISAVQQQPYSLVLINRKLDADYSDGVDILRTLKADPATTAVPVMIVSNYPEYQDEAVMLGGERGFGKNQLGQSDVIAQLEPFLGAATR